MPLFHFPNHGGHEGVHVWNFLSPFFSVWLYFLFFVFLHDRNFFFSIYSSPQKNYICIESDSSIEPMTEVKRHLKFCAQDWTTFRSNSNAGHTAFSCRSVVDEQCAIFFLAQTSGFQSILRWGRGDLVQKSFPSFQNNERNILKMSIGRLFFWKGICDHLPTLCQDMRVWCVKFTFLSLHVDEICSFFLFSGACDTNAWTQLLHFWKN